VEKKEIASLKKLIRTGRDLVGIMSKHLAVLESAAGAAAPAVQKPKPAQLKKGAAKAPAEKKVPLAKKAAAKPAVKAAAAKPAAKPAAKAAAKPAAKPAEKPAAKPVAKPEAKAAEKPVAKTRGRPAKVKI